MAGTTLTRNAFYVYFRDRYELIARLVARLRAGADAAMDAFAGGASLTEPAGREALAAAARLYAEHGEILRALAAAADDDKAAARAWAEFLEPSHRIMSEMVRREMAAGRITGIDPEPTVRALVAMNRACFFDHLVGRPNPPIDAVVDTLHAVWTRTLYRTAP